MLQNTSRTTFERKNDDLIVRVCGDIDHHRAVSVRSEIDEKILAERPARVLLELSAVEFMDSSGLGLIMGRFALVKKINASFAVLDPSEAVLKIMRLAGMEKMITVLRTKKK